MGLFRFLFAVWIAAIATGFGVLERYASTPGQSTPAPGDWPASSPLKRLPGHATLVFFAHPHCPCTRASLSQLSRILQHASAPCTVYTVFYRPGSIPPDWIKTDIYRQAAAIPGLSLYDDAGGAEARRFEATTSGYTLLYDAQGHLLFKGGITAGRGQEGDNAASQALIALLTGQRANRDGAPVFGCALLSDTPSVEKLRAWKGTNNAD